MVGQFLLMMATFSQTYSISQNGHDLHIPSDIGAHIPKSNIKHTLILTAQICFGLFYWNIQIIRNKIKTGIHKLWFQSDVYRFFLSLISVFKGTHNMIYSNNFKSRVMERPECLIDSRHLLAKKLHIYWLIYLLLSVWECYGRSLKTTCSLLPVSVSVYITRLIKS